MKGQTGGERMVRKTERGATQVQAIRVHQWLAGWNSIEWKPSERRSKPPEWFYVFSLPAHVLRRLSGVYARTTKRRRGAEDLGIQRELDQERADEISRFVEFGYPWSDLSVPKRASAQFQDLRQPGWLPTAVIVNILQAKDERRGRHVDREDLIDIDDLETGLATVRLPAGLSQASWQPTAVPPIEVIDGQHRLWACDEVEEAREFELPVVAFVGLDLSWQAYLFYTVNIKPKKINASLAFDLYPLLRTEQWLEKFEGHAIYRETRAQELVDRLWSSQDSPWYQRINMLGSRGTKGLMATQSAWVRSIMASFVKSWEGRGTRIGGLFGSKVGVHSTVLRWNLDEQAAFLIFVGSAVRDAILACREEWAEKLRERIREEHQDPAFFGQHNLLNQDQGIRTLLQVMNDLCFLKADSLSLDELFERDQRAGGPRPGVAGAVREFGEQDGLSSFIADVAESLARYDWRASGCPGLGDDERTLKASFRGSGGYKELRRDVLGHLVETGSEAVSETAGEVYESLGYDRDANI